MYMHTHVRVRAEEGERIRAIVITRLDKDTGRREPATKDRPGEKARGVEVNVRAGASAADAQHGDGPPSWTSLSGERRNLQSGNCHVLQCHYRDIASDVAARRYTTRPRASSMRYRVEISILLAPPRYII